MPLNIPNTDFRVAAGLPVGPTLEPSIVQERGAQSRPVQAPSMALGGLDAAFSKFFGGLNDASGAASNADLEQQNATQQSELDQTKIADAKQDQALKFQAQADAENGKDPDPAAQQFKTYAQTFAIVKGANAGTAAAQNFATTVVPHLGPHDNFDQAATDYVASNHFDTGDAFYDGAAAQAFHTRVMGMRQNVQADQFKAVTQDGVQQLTGALGSKVANGTITPGDLQDGLAAYKRLNPMQAANAGPAVISAVTGAATTVPQMTRTLSLLNEPGSFAPGISYAQQFPQAYAELNERFARKGQEVTSLEGAQAYDQLQQRIETARQNNDAGAMSGILSDINTTYSQYGGLQRQYMLTRQVLPVLRQAAGLTAKFNAIDQGVSNPMDRDPKLFTDAGDAYMKARGIDPLNASNAGPNTQSGQQRAVGMVTAYNAIPGDLKQRLSMSLTSGAAPDQQVAAFNFYHQVGASIGEANVLGMMNPEAQQTYQTVRDLSAGGQDPKGIFQTLADTGKSELKEVPITTIAGKPKASDAQAAINDAISTAVNGVFGTNGYRVLGGQPAAISPEVTARINAQIKSGAMVAANMGPVDLPTLAKQATEREFSNISVLPGSDGRPVVAYVPNLPQQVPDPNNPGQTRAVVPAGRSVRNPDTQQAEDTTATAQGDLNALAQHYPDRFGRGLSLSAGMGNFGGDLARSTGTFLVMEGAAPGMGGAGQPIVLDPTTPLNARLPFPLATNAPVPYAAGDSLAVGVANANGIDGNGVVGASPQAVLDNLNKLPADALKGRPVILSSGASNNPYQAGLLEQQIAAAKARGATSVNVLGVSDAKFPGVNNQLRTLATKNGATFAGAITPGADGVHPKDYRGLGMPSQVPMGVASATGGEPGMPLPTGVQVPETEPVTLGSDPKAAAAKLEHLWPGNPFALVPTQTPQGPAYFLGYRFRFTNTPPTVDEQEANWRPDTRATAARNYLGLPGVDEGAGPTLPPPEAYANLPGVDQGSTANPPPTAPAAGAASNGRGY